MQTLRTSLLALALLGLAACAPAQRTAASGDGSVTAPSTTQSGASESWQWEPNTGAGSP